MAASFPNAIKAFSAIPNGTVIAQSHFDEMVDEIQAIETEMGVNPHGKAGSIAERIALLLSDSGYADCVREKAAGVSERRRIRAGVSAVDCDTLTKSTRTSLGTITFSPPLAALQHACHAIIMLQYQESDPSLGTVPSWCNYVRASGTTTSFQFRVGARSGPPAIGTSFLIHWIAYEAAISIFSDDAY